MTGFIRFVYEVGSELWREHRRAERKEREAREWAEKRAPIRACLRCKEIAYTPGQVACAKCGSVL